MVNSYCLCVRLNTHRPQLQTTRQPFSNSVRNQCRNQHASKDKPHGHHKLQFTIIILALRQAVLLAKAGLPAARDGRLQSRQPPKLQN